MPAARYWRIVGIETYAGGDLELSELHLYGAAGRLDATATLTSTIAPTVGTLAALQDDNLGTACRFAGAAVRSGGFAFVWDFGAGNTAAAMGLRLGAAAQNVFMAGCSLQYSTDGAQWWTHSTFNRYIWPGAGAYTPAIVLDDPHIDKVALLLHMDGADGSTTFTDNSMSPKQVTADGSAKISTAQSKFGGASAYFDGTSFIKAPASQSWSFGASDFTIECYFYIAGDSATTAGGTKIGHLVACGPSSGSDTHSWYLAVDGSASSTGTGLIFGRKDSSGWESVAANITLTKAVWRHVAVAKNGAAIRIFLDGLLQASVNLTRNAVLGDYELKIGGLGFSPGWEQYFNGYIDDVRITNGVARYTTNFTPPTKAFPNGVGGEGGTVFLAPTKHTVGSAAQIAASTPVPAHSTRRAPSLQLARDAEFGGQGRIWGTTKTKGTPNTPAHARVVLLHQRSKLPVREVWSDPITGAFVFEGIDTTQQFLTLAEDAAGNFRPVAANRLTPEVLP